MRLCTVSEQMVGVFKLARRLGYPNHVIASYYVINQGRVAEVNTGQKGAHIAPAETLPADFPPLPVGTQGQLALV